MVRTEIKVTAEDYRTLPVTGPPYQLIDGELYRISPAPSTRHQQLVGELNMVLRWHAKQHGLGVVLAAPIDVFLSEHDVFQPDLAFLSSGRRDRLRDDGIHGAPDLVVGVLSPSTRKLDLGAKKALYARRGVAEYWVVDPEDETVAVYRPADGVGSPAERLGRGATLRSPMLPGLDLDIDGLFRSAG